MGMLVSYCSPMHSAAAVFTVRCREVKRSFVLSLYNGFLSGHPDLHLWLPMELRIDFYGKWNYFFIVNARAEEHRRACAMAIPACRQRPPPGD